MKRAALYAFALLLLGCFTAPNDARRALVSAGLRPVSVGGWSWWCCGEDDTYSTAFVAVNAEGDTVRGCVCDGWTKGATIRFQ